LLGRHLEDEQAAVAAAAQVTDEKLAAARAVRAQRAAIAYRVLRHRPQAQAQAPAPAAVSSSAASTAIVRSRAAARWLLARDRDEVALLADEQALLSTSRERLAAAAPRVAALPLPPRDLPWPAPGSIARGFGPFSHERSGATLSRRGLDLEVAEAAPVVALAAGTVVFAGPIRGLDEGVLIDHGTYFTLIGKLADLTVSTGTPVAAGQSVGRAARRRLYLELRLPLLPSGVPVDPAPFLADRDRP
jgi:murein hydrolase activator